MLTKYIKKVENSFPPCLLRYVFIRYKIKFASANINEQHDFPIRSIRISSKELKELKERLKSYSIYNIKY